MDNRRTWAPYNICEIPKHEFTIMLVLRLVYSQANEINAKSQIAIEKKMYGPSDECKKYFTS